MGLNEAGVDVVMELVDQVHGLRGTLRDLLDGIEAQSEEVQRRLLAEIEQPRRRDRD
jgi:chaperone modulatory protein CbpM